MRRSNGISKGVKITYGQALTSNHQKVKRTTANRNYKDILKDRRIAAEEISNLNFTQRQHILFADYLNSSHDHEHPGDIVIPEDDADSDWDDEEAAALRRPPPGEEGFLQSHAGGEATLESLLESMTFSKRIDSRTRKDRIQRNIDSWKRQTELLARCYLDWKQSGPPSEAVVSSAMSWTIDVVSFSVYDYHEFSHAPDAQYTNETLVRYGYLGASPENPTLAFSLEFLEVYRQLRRVCPRFSLDALARALCHIHRKPRQPHLADQLSSAFDAYLEIQRVVHKWSQAALGRDELWERQHVCAPCFYKTEDEPALKFSFLAAMDGNNSLKLVDSTFRSGSVRTDTRSSVSGRWILPDVVDLFKDEVNRKAAALTQAHPAPSHTPPVAATQAVVNDVDPALPDADVNDENVAWLNVTEIDELAQCVNTCVERWRNAGPEARKKMFALFAVAGIFLAVCRHGHVLVICDMIRSGELMKYPLAIVDQLIDTYGSDICLGYDIMCAFIKTLSRSVLGPKKVAFRLHGVVPSFHGHAHNRGCQLHWHPMYTEGVGLEDFEECERTFAKSNELASVTRLASPYHRQQHIDEHFSFHDQDKHAASGNFIFQNYRQALNKIEIESRQLAALASKLNTTDSDYEEYLQAERDHLQSLKAEPDSVKMTVDYMELLSKLFDLKKQSDDASKEFKALDYNIIHKRYTMKEIKQVRTRYGTTFTRYQVKEEEVTRFEEEHDIEERWLPTSEAYRTAEKLLVERSYRRAVDNLERLVVQRLFELTKLGMNGVGYKLREKITKALRTRSDAIKSALKAYNDAAGRLNPPRPQLTWSAVLKAATVADFDLLRDTRTDIRCLPWTEPSRREATSFYFGIKRAREEIIRLNVEITRLLTFMLDSHSDYSLAIQANLVTNPSLAHELMSMQQYQDRIHEQIVRKLVETSRLPGFTGKLAFGTRIGRTRDPLEAELPQPSWVALLTPSGSTTGVTLTHPAISSFEETNDYDVPREVNVDTEAVIMLVERINAKD